MARSRVRRQGFALMTVLALAGFLMVVAAAIGSQVLSNQHATKSRLSNSRARYAAYAGLQHATLLLRSGESFAPQELVGVLMPGSQSVSYTVEVTDNRAASAGDPLTAPDGTEVPPGAVYCAAVGVDNGKEGVALHAMAGMLSNQQPRLNYAAFSDQSARLVDQAQCLSYHPDQGFEADAPRPTPSTLGEQGHLGTNRYAELGSNVTLQGDLFRPTTDQMMMAVLEQEASAAGVDVQTLPAPVEIPRYSPPAATGGPALSASSPISGGDYTSGTSQITTFPSVAVPPGETLTLGPGKYFVTGDMLIEGTLAAAPEVNADAPIVLYVGGNTALGGQAKVNLGGNTAGLQLYFTDKGAETQTFTMTGQADFFGTVVGHRVEGEFSDQAQMFGGFLGRGVSVSGSAKLLFDESLMQRDLAVAGNWGLSGVTEPKPKTLLTFYPLSRQHVTAVESGTVSYRPSSFTLKLGTPAF